MQVDSFLAFSVLNSSLHLLVDLYAEKYRVEDKEKAFAKEPEDFGLPVKETFDFIIVGGGTAGCLLANRLSENFTVLLLESGGTPSPLESIPWLSQPLKWIESVHHVYNSVPQKNTALRYGGIVWTSAGNFLGGSSSHNYAQYERGSPFDYDNWAKITGDDSWNYQNMLQHFLKLENYSGQFSLDNGQHSRGGPMNVRASNVSFREDLFFLAGKELGFEIRDPNGPQMVGFSPAEHNWDERGRRVSTYSAFVKPIENTRKTLTVRRYSVVSEVLFEGKVAVGVKYERHGIPSVAFVKKEVILSAGAYVSPLILIKSGIGPLEQLEAAKISPVSILPVGQNFQDHVAFSLPIKVQDKSIFKSRLDQFTFEDLNTFVESGKGLFSEFGVHEAFIASTRARKLDGNPEWPDIQLYLGSSRSGSELYCAVNVNRPYSRGKLELNSTATTLQESLQPILDYNFFGDETDFDVALEGIEMCRRIVENTTTFASIGAYMPRNVAPECAGLLTMGASDREHELCIVRYSSYSNYHIAATVPMGTLGDSKAVLDSKLRVRGVKNLRVCDASVMPTVVNANIAAAVMAIAQKTAEEITQTWSSSNHPMN